VAGIGAVNRVEPGRMAFSDPLQASMEGSRPRLKIVFVDSCSHRRSSRLRRNPSRTIRQDCELSVVAEKEIFGGTSDEDVHSISCGAIEHESDRDYHDDEVRSAKRLRRGRKLRRPRKQKRHGRLAVADRDLIFEAQQGPGGRKPLNNTAPSIVEEDAINLAASIVESIDGRQAVAAQNELKKIFQGPLVKSGQPECGRKSVSIMIDGGITPANLQLRRHWSDVLVRSASDRKTQ
jgi:hypothetical protein